MSALGHDLAIMMESPKLQLRRLIYELAAADGLVHGEELGVLGVLVDAMREARGPLPECDAVRVSTDARDAARLLRALP